MTTQERNAAVETFYRTHRATLEKKVANRVSGASRALIEDACQTAWAVLLRRPDIGLPQCDLGQGRLAAPNLTGGSSVLVGERLLFSREAVA